MSLFWNCFPQFEDANGEPFLNGKIYFGEPNQDPKTNPKTIYLNDEFTAPASNPQPLNSRGVPSEGQLYMVDGEYYSVLLEDAQGNFVAQAQQVSGVYLPASFAAVPPVTVIDQLEVESTTTAEVLIDSGVVPNAVGRVLFQEVGASQFAIERKAIVDGGALLVTNLSAGGVDEVEFPLTGGFIARFQGVERLRTTSDGVDITGDIGKSPQVPIAYGTFTAAGVPVGLTTGIASAGPAAGSPPGEYEIVLSEPPTDENNLNVMVQAELAGAEMNSRGTGGPLLSGTALIFTSNGDTNARANCTTFTVFVFDAGRD